MDMPPPDEDFETHVRADGIRVFRVYNVSPPIVERWENFITKLMDTTQTPQKRLYDFRAVTTVPLHAVRAAARARYHPNSHLVWVAVLVADAAVWGLADWVLQLRNRNEMRLMADEAAAIRWLNTCVPPSPPGAQPLQPENRIVL